MRQDSRLVEFELIQDKIEQIDELIYEGENNMNWKSNGIHIKNLYNVYIRSHLDFLCLFL